MSDIPELNPQQGGSYVRDPETGELRPAQEPAQDQAPETEE